MIRDRLVGYVIAARGYLTWAWPFLLALAVTGNLVVLPLLVAKQAEVLRETKGATELNRALIRSGLPCRVGDDPATPACVAQARRDQALADALAAVQAQHDLESQHLDDAIARLIELQSRQHGFSPEPLPAPVVTPPPRRTPAPRITTPTRPRFTTRTTARPPATTVPAPTTVCEPPACKPPKGKP